MFKPLEGDEYNQRLEDKYGHYEDDEDDDVVKREKLSQILFQSRSPAGTRVSSKCKSPANVKKAVVTVGGEPVKGSRNKRHRTADNDVESRENTCTSVKKKQLCRLDIRGGQVLDRGNERKSVKRISDISSIVNPEEVEHAFSKIHKQSPDPDTDDCTADRRTEVSKLEDYSFVSADRRTEVTKMEEDSFIPVDRKTEVTKVEVDSFIPADSHAEGGDSFENGFDDDNMEKPKFNIKDRVARVPLLLSEEGEAPVVQVPAILNQYLRDYQREGIQFLYSHYKYGRGAILGDDMGLGKTVQVIGFLAALLGKQGNRVDVMKQKPRFIRKLSDSSSVRQDCAPCNPFLIIGPGCVLYNWLDELETWGYFNVRKFHGQDKAECLADIKKGKIEVVVTTFETFREHLTSLNSIKWEAVFADEVHKIKGLKAQTSKALRSIRTRRRYGLTGTALQNNLIELWSILDWAQPGCLGLQSDFQEEYVDAIEGGQRHDANKRELALARKKKERFAEIRKGMMIRRTKALISAQLPNKEDNVVFCRLSQLQTSIYETVLSHPNMQYVLNMHDPCPCDSGEEQSKCCFKKTKDGQSVKSLMFTLMHLLLKVANHVALLIPTAKTSANQVRHARKICEAVLQEHQEFVTQTREASFKTLSNPKYCGKMKILQGLLKVFDRDHSKVLLFSYSTQVLDIIEQFLMATGYEYRRIDGTVSAKKRLIIVREFNSDPNIFICLISTKAGGLGLNLTGANKVVIFDPNWNPAHDLQAQDRAYRIGQRRNVQVYRLVTAGTIEENMYLRQIYKQQLLNISVEDENARRYFYAVQGKQKGELYGVKNMFRLQKGEACLTMDILKRNEKVESALAGFDVTKYVPPVIRVDEEDDDDDEEKFLPAPQESEEDAFAEFFASLGIECDDMKLGDFGEPSKQANRFQSTSGTTNLQYNNANLEDDEDISDLESESKSNNRLHTLGNKANKNITKEKKVVKFQTPDVSVLEKRRGGKVHPTESKTGKGRLRVVVPDRSEFAVDQTLAGTFSDVMDVFDNCGVVHIHENVKVVGGSRAEDHMTKCALTDVYELHQNSQNLAAQCDPLAESSEEEPDTSKERHARNSGEDETQNIPRSTVRHNIKVLIGQTPKTFRMKQLENMWKQHKCSTLTEFAELVLGSTVEERIQLLNKYYESQEPALKDIHVLLNRPQNDKKMTSSTNVHKQTPKRELSNIKMRKLAPKHQRKNSKGPDQSISFLDQCLSDSESLDRGDADQPVSVSQDMLSASSSPYRDVNVTPRHRQRIVGRKSQRKSKQSLMVGPHTPVPQTYFDIDFMEEESDVQSVEKKSTSRDHVDDRGYGNYDNSVDSCELFQDMQNLSEESENSQKRATKSDTDSKPRRSEYINDRKGIYRKASAKESESKVSILDDIFGNTSETRKTRKPPPGKRKFEEISFHPKEQKSNSKYAAEIFVEKASNVLDFLDTSTLKDEDTDCLSSGGKWKKRKKKATQRQNMVDQLIADSDADYNDLFTKGKMKKREKARGNDSFTGDNEDEMKVSEEEYDGSLSLFS